MWLTTVQSHDQKPANLLIKFCKCWEQNTSAMLSSFFYRHPDDQIQRKKFQQNALWSPNAFGMPRSNQISAYSSSFHLSITASVPFAVEISDPLCEFRNIDSNIVDTIKRQTKEPKNQFKDHRHRRQIRAQIKNTVQPCLRQVPRLSAAFWLPVLNPGRLDSRLICRRRIRSHFHSDPLRRRSKCLSPCGGALAEVALLS